MYASRGKKLGFQLSHKHPHNSETNLNATYIVINISKKSTSQELITEKLKKTRVTKRKRLAWKLTKISPKIRDALNGTTELQIWSRLDHMFNKKFCRKKNSEASSTMKETVSIDIRITSRNGGRKIIQPTRTKCRPPQQKAEIDSIQPRHMNLFQSYNYEID